MVFANGMALEFETPPGILLRPAGTGDYQFAEKLYLESTKRLLCALGSWDEAAVVARFAKSFQRNPAQVIRSDGADIGWLQVSQSAKGLHLHQLHILDCYRNRGIGSRLIQAVMAHARSLGAHVSLNVIRGNPAIALYLRLGFRVVGEDKERLRMRWDAAPPENS